MNTNANCVNYKTINNTAFAESDSFFNLSHNITLRNMIYAANPTIHRWVSQKTT